MTVSLTVRDVPSLQEKEYGMIEMPQPHAVACWRKSRASGDTGACVQVICSHEQVWVRDSKNPFGPFLGFTREGWAAFLIGVQRDEFDRSGVPA